MELSWTTFVLEIVNFLVLVWILQRFLYKPVRDTIERRRAAIDQTLRDAQARQNTAEDLRAQYEHRLADWERERQDGRRHLQEQLEAERARRLQALETTLAEEREKARVAEERRREEFQRRAEQKALEQGAQFATRLLSRASGPDLDAALCDLFLDELAALPTERRDALRTAAAATTEPMVICTAYPLERTRRTQLEQAVRTMLKVTVPMDYRQDKALLAGLRVTVGPVVLRLNLADELHGFVDVDHGR